MASRMPVNRRRRSAWSSGRLAAVGIGLVVAVASLPTVPPSAAEAAAAPDPWAPVRILEGVWEGMGEGFGQTSTVTHRWQFVLGGKFLRLETRSVGTSASGEKEIHEDVGYVSWSPSAGVLRFRQFLSEGFVNTFRIETASSSRPGLDFEPESSEGSGMSARMTLRFDRADLYEMVLELGKPGGELTPCQSMKMRRVD